MINVFEEKYNNSIDAVLNKISEKNWTFRKANEIKFEKKYEIKKTLWQDVYEIKTDKDSPCDIFYLAFPKIFPYAPCTLLAHPSNYKKLKGLPGVDNEYIICVYDYSVSRPNPTIPAEVVIDLIEKGINRIERGLKGENKQEYLDEFESYWGLNTEEYLDVYTNNLKDKQVYDVYTTSNRKFICSSNVFNIKGAKEKAILFNTEYEFFPNEDVDILKLLNTDQLSFFKEHKTINYLIINLLKIKNLIAIKFNKRDYWTLRNHRINKDLIKSLMKNATKVKIKIFNDFYYWERAGQGKNISKNSTITIIGCGALGSNLTMHLLQLGITNFKLFDYDFLKYENVGRHIGDISHINSYKTDVVKEKLIFKNPSSIICDTYNENFFTKLKEEPSLINSTDIIIDTSGDSICQVALIEWLKYSEFNGKVILCGVEPLMVAGHVIIIDKQTARQAESLYDDMFLYKNRFIKEPQSKKLSGCNCSYIEYGGLDLQEYVTKTTRIINQVLNNKQVPMLVCFTGDLNNPEILKNNLKFTYRLETDKKFNQIDSYKNYKFDFSNKRWINYDIYSK